MRVGERIRDLRIKENISQNALAEMAGISQSHLRRVELGQAGITTDHLQMICDVFGMTLSEFFMADNKHMDEFSRAVARLTPRQKSKLLDFIKSLK